jgi:hypothetical protein
MLIGEKGSQMKNDERILIKHPLQANFIRHTPLEKGDILLVGRRKVIYDDKKPGLQLTQVFP